jgi:transposase InsO family protein
LKLKVVREIAEGRTSIYGAAKLFSLGVTTVKNWWLEYEAHGAKGLEPKPRRQSKAASAVAEAVVEKKRENPEAGTRRIRDLLARFEAIGVSETQVRKVLHEAGLMPSLPASREREAKPPRRFERARPNQMWQSDIFTFLLRKHQRIYLAGFMDDHSRFMVSHVVAHHQKSGLVIEALERGIAQYGSPSEILTDNSRQYTAWRGETEFEEALRQHGITHIKSRPQHPMTLGKIERFWKTLWDEFLSKTVFDDFVDCEKRLALFIQAYNFQRPHQSLDGLVPADRFFAAAQEVREAIEKNIAANALRLAHQRPPKKPFYLVGKLGDQELSIAATSGGVRVQVGDGEPEMIEMHSKENVDDGSQTRTNAQGRSATADAALERRDRRDGEASVLDAPLGAERAVDDHESDQGRADLVGDVLPARDARVERDARSAGAGDEDGEWARALEELLVAASEGGTPRAGEAPARETPRDDDEDREAWSDEDGDGPPDEEEANALNDEEIGGQADRARSAFDVDDGWRGRAVSWDRKLTGRDAPWRDDVDEEIGLRGAAGYRSDGAPRDLAPPRSDHARDERPNQSDGRGEGARPLSRSLPDDLPPGTRRDDGPARAGDAGPAGARSGEGPSRRTEREVGSGSALTDDPTRGVASSDDGPAEIVREQHSIGKKVAREKRSQAKKAE